jgi:imidazolonepropionase-like amidohydrolase
LKRRNDLMKSRYVQETLRASLRLFCFLSLFVFLLNAQDSLVIKAGTVLVGDGNVLKDVFIVIKDGKIASIGKANPVEKDADIRDFKSKVLAPGFIAANATMNAVGQKNEEGWESTPEMNLLYSINPKAEDFHRAWSGGVTCVYLAPGNRNVFNGTGTVMKTKGTTPQDMLVRNHVHLKVVLGWEPGQGNAPPRFVNPVQLRTRRPQNRMGVVFIVRYELTNLQNKSQVPDTELSPEEILLRRVLEGSLPLRIRARSYLDIQTAFRLMEEFGYQWILEDGVDAYRYLDDLKANKIPVVYGPVYKRKGRGDFNREGDMYMAKTPVLLAEKGIPFAFQNNEECPIDALRDEAIYAVELGLSKEGALKALTLDAARILGVEDRVGSLTRGKDADILIFDGDPFEPSSCLEGVMIDGKILDPNK